MWHNHNSCINISAPKQAHSRTRCNAQPSYAAKKPAYARCRHPRTGDCRLCITPQGYETLHFRVLASHVHMGRHHLQTHNQSHPSRAHYVVSGFHNTSCTPRHQLHPCTPPAPRSRHPSRPHSPLTPASAR
jgi:hypothetical protein